MDNDQGPIRPALNCSLHTMVSRSLLRLVDELRQAIQDGITGDASISRADVVRLALRRLGMAYVVHLSEGTDPPGGLLERWDALASDIACEGNCPTWLLPGADGGTVQPILQTKTKTKTKTKKGE